MKVFELFRKIVSNKIVGFVLSRYATYFIQFVNSLFIAVSLGPYYLGVWGFINLIVQYLAQLNFGIANSVLTFGAVNRKHMRYVQFLYSNAIGMIIILSAVIGVFFLLYYAFDLQIGEKYNFKVYGLVVLFIGVLNYFISVFSNFFRLIGRLKEVAFSQSIMPILFLITSFFFKGEQLLNALVYANLVAFMLSFILFLINSPVKLFPKFNIKTFRIIQHKGKFLFLYNTSFYLIIISTRTFVSAFYPVKEFGIFTFSYSLASVFLLLLDSFSFLILPKAINKLSTSSPIEAKNVLDKLRSIYIVIAHFIVHIACLLFPLFLIYFSKYSQALDSFRFTALSVVIYANTFGIQSLLISKGKEKRLGIFSFYSLMLNVTLLIIFVLVLKVNFKFVILSTLISYLIYCVLLAWEGNKVLFGDTGRITPKQLLAIFPINLLIPYLISLCLTFINSPNLFYILPLFLFVGLNWTEFKKIKDIGLQLLYNPKQLDF